MKRHLLFAMYVLLTACLIAQNCQCAEAQTITKFPYVMPPSQRAKFLAGFKTIKAGDTYERVISVLGPPSYEATLAGKEFIAPVRGVGVHYYLKILDSGVTPNRDEHVELWFNNDKKLVSACTEIPGIFIPSDLTIEERVSENWRITRTRHIYKEGREVKERGGTDEGTKGIGPSAAK